MKDCESEEEEEEEKGMRGFSLKMVMGKTTGNRYTVIAYYTV